MALPQALRNLLRLFLRPACPGCGEARSDGERLCPWCMQRLESCPTPHLSSTGRVLSPKGEELTVEGCSGVPVHSALMYRGLPGEIVLRLKFGRESHLDTLAAWLISEYSDVLPRPGELLVPVPSGPSKRRARGYSQASLISSKLAPMLGCRHMELLERDDGPSQIGLPSTLRRSNVSGVFRMRRGAAGRLSENPLRVWLVDDVATTCSTIDSAAKVLLEAGAPAVEGITLTYRGRTGGSIVSQRVR